MVLMAFSGRPPLVVMAFSGIKYCFIPSLISSDSVGVPGSRAAAGIGAPSAP